MSGYRSWILGWSLLLASGLMFAPLTGVLAAGKQGGGAFTQPKPKPARKKPATRVNKPQKQERVIAHDYNGKYKVNMKLLSNTTTYPCFSGARDFQIVNNSMSMRTWALGDRIGGRVSGGQLILSKLAGGVLSGGALSGGEGQGWTWSGSVTLPRAKGQSVTGSFRGLDDNGTSCNWAMKVTRL